MVHSAAGEIAVMPVDLATEAGADLVRRTADRHGDAIRGAAVLPERLFLLRSALAPGLRFVGGIATVERDGRVEVFNQAGTGDEIEDAFAACLGETAERLAQIERGADVVLRGNASDATGARVLPQVAEAVRRCNPTGDLDAMPSIDWVEARDLASGHPTLVPADWCLRRPVEGPLRIAGSAPSTGVAASPDPARATLSALLELIERDAAALWWIGGRRARAWAADGQAMQAGGAVLARVRQGVTSRASWLLDITTDLGVPCVAALSVDADGRELACGLAAHLDAGLAARRAVLEMCQMEVSNLLVAAKLGAQGPDALDPFEQRLLARNATIDATACELLHPHGPPRVVAPCDHLTANAAVARLGDVLRRHDIDVALVHFARVDMAFAVVSAVAPRLQLFPADVVSARLQAVIRETGGGARWTGGAALL